MLNCSPGSCYVDIDQCKFVSCNSKAPGSIIYVSDRDPDPSKPSVPNYLTLTNTVLTNCWVGGNNLTHTAGDGDKKYGYTIVGRFMTKFEFRRVTIEWPENQQGQVHSSCLLRFIFFDPEATDVSIDNCEFKNTVVPEGMLSLLSSVRSFTYNHLVLRNISMGNTTHKAGLTPSNKPINSVHIVDCLFEGCSTERGFMDAAYIIDIHTMDLQKTNFSKCTCNNAAFLDLDNLTELIMTSCHFGNCYWKETSSHLLLLLVKNVGNTTISFINFDLPQVSLSEVGMAFGEGDFHFNNCVFVVTCDEPNCTLLLGDCPLARFECCAFSVKSRDSDSIVAPLLQFNGTDPTHELQFYNCCFFKPQNGTYENTGTALYLSLNGTSNVVFESTCFDLNKPESVIVDTDINASYDRPDIMWGKCECEIFAPMPTDELESLVPENSIYFSPTAPLNWITGEGQAKPAGRPVDPGLISGIVVGLLLLRLLLILLILFFLWCRKKKSSSESEQESNDEESLSGQILPPVPVVTEPPLWAKEVTDNTVYAESFEEEEMPPLTCPADA